MAVACREAGQADGCQRLQARDREVHVEVVAVGEVDARAELETRIGEAELGGRQPLRKASGDPVAGLDGPFGVEGVRAAVELRPQEVRLREHVIVVPRDERDALAGEPVRGLREEGLDAIEDADERQLPELHQVTEEHDPVGRRQRLEQPLARKRPPGHVRVRLHAQVEIETTRVRTAPMLAGGRGAQPGRRPGEHRSSRSQELRSSPVPLLPPQPLRGRLPDLLEGHRARLVEARAAELRLAAEGAKKAAAQPPTYRGPHASAGPYSDDEGSYEVRIERVPGGLRLASWMAGSIRRAAPTLRADDVPQLLRQAAEAGVIEDELADGVPMQEGASPGRAGELQEELRVEPLEDGRVRVARWILRPNRGWELQEAPVMLPAARYAEAFLRASG